MADEIKQFWKTLVESGLLTESACSTIRSKYESVTPERIPDPENLANWLCEQKTISPFQANILLNTENVAFRYGNYVLIDCNSKGTATGRYAARHRSTGHPVYLDFVGGPDSQALMRWKQTKRVAELAIATTHPNLTRVFEWGAIAEYRFVVSEIPFGKRLSDQVPLKSRIPAADAARIICQIANALGHLHSLDCCHGDVSTEKIWLEKSGLAVLEFPLAVARNQHVEQAFSDLRAKDVRDLGTIWHRLASGRIPVFEAEQLSQPTEPKHDNLERLEKYGLSPSTIGMIRTTLSSDIKDVPPANAIVAHCKKLLDDNVDFKLTKTVSPTLTQFAAWLVRTPAIQTDQHPNFITESEVQFEIEPPVAEQPSDIVAQSADIDLRDVVEIETHATKRSRSLLFSIIGSAGVLVSLLGLVVVFTMHKPNQRAVRMESNRSELETLAPPGNVDQRELENDVQPPPNITSNSEGHFVKQILIGDDKESLWETPTTGIPIDFAWVPAAPKIAISLRPAELVASQEGRRLLQAFGPAINQHWENLIQQIGVQPTEIAQLLITFHSNSEFTYDPFFVVSLSKPVDKEILLESWVDSARKESGESTYYVRDEQSCFGFTRSTETTVERFVAGPETLVKESLELQGVDASAGAMKRLSARSDRDRHLTIMFLRSGLFNDEGQKLMGAPLAQLNRKMSLAIDNHIRGISFSLHLDEGTYIEIQFERTLDLKSEQLKNLVSRLFQNIRDQLSSYSISLSANPFWDQARLRYAAMLADVGENLRVGSEDENVICNGWLAPAAAHNLIATTELLLSFGESQFLTRQTDAPKTTPQTIEDLLREPRDLSVSTSPDLTILIGNLQQEIIDDYGSLPFEFEIRLMGSDLSKEGITQNQRPEKLDIKQKPLSEILTKIMVRANPDKNINGPSDMDCKMVWVVAADPKNPANRIILITTRSAAAEKSYQLPPAFSEQ